MSHSEPTAPMTRGPRLQTVTTNLRCNQNCTYCNRRAETDDLARIAPTVLRQQIAQAIAHGAEEIRFSGGEPTLRRDLVQLVQTARELGALRVSLETNATLLDDDRAQALAAAGLTTARVNLVGTDARVDAVTRDEGGVVRTVAGIRALLAAGVQVEILAVLTKSTRPLVEALPRDLVPLLADVGRPSLLELAVPTEGPDPDDWLDYPAAAEALVQIEAACRQVGLHTKLAVTSGPPPCLFPPRRGLPHLYKLSPGARKLSRHSQIPACDTCLMRDRCSGLADSYLRHFGPPDVHPIVDEKAVRRLNMLLPLADQIAAELTSPSMLPDADGNPVYDTIVRINFHCNQSCAFCFVSTHLPAATDTAIDKAIREAGALGHRIVLSGGEPTLNKRLLHWIALSKEVSTRPVCLQTNAIRLDDAELARAVVAAGVSQAFVSVHGATAAVCDAVTDTPGTFVRTVRGVDNLYALDVELSLNFVLCAANMAEFPAFIELVAARWPKALANFSFVAPSTDLVPKEKRLIPSYSTMLPFLAEGLRVADKLGVQVVGFESMCGLPLCLIPEPFDRNQLQLTALPEGMSEGEFVRSDACDTCSYRDRCYGLRRGYAELHGTGELRPIPEP